MSDHELAKDLGLVSALSIGIGTMVGAGIFVLPGVAAQRAGPIVVVSFILGGLVAMLNALSVSELGTAMPKAGGAYYFVNRSLGPLFGSISGLGDWLGLAFASAFYSIGFGQYLRELMALPSVLFLTDIQVGALIAGVIFVGVNYLGAKETGGVQSFIVAVLLTVLTLFAAVGWFTFDWSVVVSEGGLMPLGVGQVLPATGLVFVSFLGYAKIATVAEEMKDPGRNLPIAIVGSVAIVTVIYTILVTLMLGLVPWPEMDLQAPLTQATEVAFPGGAMGVAATVITLGALLATASSANASILASARINFAMGRDLIVTDWLNKIHARFATPYRSILVTGGMILGFIVLLGRDLAILAEAASVLHLIVFALLNAALIVFRETDHPGYDPDFRVPLYPFVPALGFLFSLGLIAFMQPASQLVAVFFVAGAIVWYVAYARHKTPISGALGNYILERPNEMPEIAVSAAEAASPDVARPYRVMVPIANPETTPNLVAMASTLAKQRDGIVQIVHIVDVPPQTSLEAVASQLDRVSEGSTELLETAREAAEEHGVEVEMHRILSHRSFREIFDAAERLKSDTVVMGWSPRRAWTAGRTGGALRELTRDLPCDFLVYRDRGFDASRVLLPTAGGSDSDLAAEAAKAFRDVYGAEVSVLHVVSDASEHARGMSFLGEWAHEAGLGDAELMVDTSGDVEASIERAAQDHSLVLIGATREGLISRLVSDTLVFDVVETLECSVVMAERPSKRSLRERLFGSREHRGD